ncbi:cell wall glucanosyltransferase Mwg1 [Purpureocillium lavendulum]|uniref:Cell wall glucanosyltransferase Mwg1 n=1 Tax=Purpureocillium lavendulum TaxID=1247861 RepID=A0AB34FCN7_9HYPO|nr:cell wall glucanosyltransferase Mwg1 [Purpureocillium lavendulum]
MAGLEVEELTDSSEGGGVREASSMSSSNKSMIDWEWVGGDNAQVQTNYFSKGDNSTYDRGAFHNVANPTAQFHTYTLEWTSQAVTWSIDGAVVRTLTAASAKGGAAFPQTPMQVKLGTWIGGRKDAPKGVVQWAGGYADYSKGPFLAYYKSITITDYAGKDKPANGGIKQYIYSDNSGSWQSIKVVVGSGDDTSTSSAASSATPTIGSKTFQASSTASTEAVVSKTTSVESKTTFASTTSSASSTRSDSGSGNSTASTVAGSSTSRAANSTASTIGPQTFPASSTSSTVSAVLRTTSAESKTTLVTATSSASSTRSGSGSGNSTASTVAGSSTSRAVGSTAPTILPSVAARGVVAVGSVLLAGAGILAVQLLL